MEVLQLCELKDTYGYAGFYFSDNHYWQFRVTESHTFVKRLKYKRSLAGHKSLFELLKNNNEPVEPIGPFPAIPELTLEQLDFAATEMPPNSLNCSWVQSGRIPFIVRHETLLSS